MERIIKGDKMSNGSAGIKSLAKELEKACPRYSLEQAESIINALYELAEVEYSLLSKKNQ